MGILHQLQGGLFILIYFCMVGCSCFLFDRNLNCGIYVNYIHSAWKSLMILTRHKFPHVGTGQQTSITNYTMQLSHIPQYTIQNRNVSIVGYGTVALWGFWDWSTVKTCVKLLRHVIIISDVTVARVLRICIRVVNHFVCATSARMSLSCITRGGGS